MVRDFRSDEILRYIRDEFVRVGSSGLYENRLRGIGFERRREEEEFELRFIGSEMRFDLDF